MGLCGSSSGPPGSRSPKVDADEKDEEDVPIDGRFGAAVRRNSIQYNKHVIEGKDKEDASKSAEPPEEAPPIDTAEVGRIRHIDSMRYNKSTMARKRKAMEEEQAAEQAAAEKVKAAS